jgi:putative peptidoglycan lipid II flippase
MRTPVRIAVGVLILTQVFNAIFVFGFKVGVAGLSLSIGLGALVNAFLLLRGLRKLGSYTPEAGWPMFLLRVVIAGAAMGALQWWLASTFDWTGGKGGHFELVRAGWMALSLGGSALLYFTVLLLLGVKLRHFARRG